MAREGLNTLIGSTQPASTMRQMTDRIAHLEGQLRHHGITPMGEFICACGLRKSAPVENEPPVLEEQSDG